MLYPPFPGGAASQNPRSCVVTGGGSFVAGPDGLIGARFGWGGIDGRARNERLSDTDLLGFVQPASGLFRWQRAWGGTIMRPGTGVLLFSGGDFWAAFDDGAEPGADVYASLIDGRPVAGYTQPADTMLTPWSVIVGTEPGGLAVISTWSKFE